MIMESSSYIFLLSILILCNSIEFSYSFSSSTNPRCHEDERSSLLQFKDSFLSTNSCFWVYSYPKVESWKDLQGERGDCCSWDGVECDKKTNHVISLDLSNSCLYGFITSNGTLFRLVHLQRLNLAFNNFNSSKMPPEIGNLSNLTYLNFSWSSFSGRVPPQISNLSKLVSLDLSYNFGLKLHKPSLRGLVQPLINLKKLHLSAVDIFSSVPEFLANFSSLESLRLLSCGLNGEFPIAVFHLPNLKMLDLRFNFDLGGYLPKFQLGSSLESLLLTGTNFGGELPPSIGNLVYLEKLDIFNCHFTGKLPPSLGNLTNLKYLDLSNNSFSATITSSLSWVSKLSKLSSLTLMQVNLNGEFPSSLMNLTQLSYLSLSDNQLIGPIPSWLMNMTNLVGLSLGGNHLNSSIPSSLIYETKIKYLYLWFNQFSGEIPSQANNHSQLIDLGLSFNKLQGSIPTTISYLKNLEHLDLESNNLAGTIDLNSFFQLKNLTTLKLSFNNLRFLTKSNTSASNAPDFKDLGLASCNLSEFPSFLLKQSRLQFLDLSSNQIHGHIPSWIWNITSPNSHLNISHNFLTGFEEGPVFHQWAHLQVLDLRSNMLQGSVLHKSTSGDKCNLYMINLSHNQLRGQIPRSLANCSSLEFLDFGHNQLTDTFPSWLGILPELKVLILQSNGFYGALGKIETTSSFSKLQIIDISHNAFAGDLPTVYFKTWDAMMNADASKFTFMRYSVGIYFPTDYSITLNNKGLELEYLMIPKSFAAIDFSHNKFQGVIPDAIGNLTRIHMLNLSNNILTGHIPSSIANMKELECLDLSGNELFGKIPFQLTQLTFLSSFNVSYNNLSGLIPQGKQFDTFDNSSYEGNLELCGVPLNNKCEPLQASPSDEDSKSAFEVNWLIVAMGYASGLVVGVVAGNEVIKRKNNWFMKIFLRKQQ